MIISGNDDQTLSIYKTNTCLFVCVYVSSPTLVQDILIRTTGRVISRMPKLIKDLRGQDCVNIHPCRYRIPKKYSKSKGVKYMVFIQNKIYASNIRIIYAFSILFICVRTLRIRIPWRAYALKSLNPNQGAQKLELLKKIVHGLSLYNRISRHRIFARRNCENNEWSSCIHGPNP